MCKWGSDPANGAQQVEGTPTLLLGNVWIYYPHIPEKWQPEGADGRALGSLLALSQMVFL
jgi:hypothetical protein